MNPSIPSHAEAAAESLRHTERIRLRALVDANMTVARPLHADDFQLITPIGVSLSKEEYLGAVASGHIQYLVWQPETIEVRIYGDAAVMRYRAQLEVNFGGLLVPRSRYWHTDTYERRQGRWVVVWSQATAIQ